MAPPKARSAEAIADPEPGESMDSHTGKRILRSRSISTQSSDASQKSRNSKPNSATRSKLTAVGQGESNDKEQTDKKGGGKAPKAMAAPARPQNGRLSRFTVNDQNNLMSEPHSLTMGTPFDNEGELPQRMVNIMQRRRSAKRLKPARETQPSSCAPPPGADTQDLLLENLSPQDTIRRQFGLQRPLHGKDDVASSRVSPAEPLSAQRLAPHLREENVLIEGQDNEPSRHKSPARTDDSLYDGPPPMPVPALPNPKRKGRASRTPTRQSDQHIQMRSVEARAAPMGGPLDSGTLKALDDSSLQQGPRSQQTFDYNKYKDDGLTVLAALAYRQAKERRWTVATQMTEEDWRAIAVPMLCSMRSQDIKDLIDGYAINADRDETEQDVWNQNGKEEAPVIYARGICETRTGRSLTARELRQVILRLQLYITPELDERQIDLVKAVDDTTARSGSATKLRYVKEGRRHFFDGNWLSVEAHRRREIVSIFCRQCNSSIDLLPDVLLDDPLRILYYIGYTLRFSGRMQDHRNANSGSSWFMNLFLAACKAVHNEPSTVTWGFADSALCYCVEEKEAPVGEVLLTLLAKAWYSDGLGLGIHPPGLSMASSTLNTRTMDAARQLWQKCEDFRREHTPFFDNMDMELRRVRAYPIKHMERVSAMASRIPDVQDEAQAVQERVAREKNDLRREMARDLEQARKDYAHLAKFVPRSDRRGKEKMQYCTSQIANAARRLKALGSVDPEDTEDEDLLPQSTKAQPQRPMDIESYLPNDSQYGAESSGDMALPSREVAELSPGVGPSNWQMQAQ